MSLKNEEAMKRALRPLNEVMTALLKPIKKCEFDKRFRGVYVSPGITAMTYLRQLRMGGFLVETKNTVRFRKHKKADMFGVV